MFLLKKTWFWINTYFSNYYEFDSIIVYTKDIPTRPNTYSEVKRDRLLLI
jgi:hypothetical protein